MGRWCVGEKVNNTLRSYNLGLSTRKYSLSAAHFWSLTCRAGVFRLSLEFTEDYPMKPPVVKFVSRLFHPNSALVIAVGYHASRFLSGYGRLVLGIAIMQYTPMEISAWISSRRNGAPFMTSRRFSRPSKCVAASLGQSLRPLAPRQQLVRLFPFLSCTVVIIGTEYIVTGECGSRAPV